MRIEDVLVEHQLYIDPMSGDLVVVHDELVRLGLPSPYPPTMESLQSVIAMIDSLGIYLDAIDSANTYTKLIHNNLIVEDNYEIDIITA